MEMIEILQAAVKKGASDVHIVIGLKPMVRIRGAVLPLDEFTFQASFKQSVANSIRWLVEWMKRVLLLAPERTEFKNS